MTWAAGSADAAGQVVRIRTSHTGHVACVEGLQRAAYGELARFEAAGLGQVVGLFEDHVEVVPLGCDLPEVGSGVQSTGFFPEVPVGQVAQGAVIDPLGRSQGEPFPSDASRRRVGFPAPSFLRHQCLDNGCFETGVKAIDILLPIRVGEARALAGPRGSGKTSLAAQIMRHRASLGHRSVFVSVGARDEDIAQFVESLGGARERCTVVSAPRSTPYGLQQLAVDAGCAVASGFRDEGDEVLLVVDSLNRALDAIRMHNQNAGLIKHVPTGWRRFAASCEHAARLPEGGSLTILVLVETALDRDPQENDLLRACGGLPGQGEVRIVLSRVLRLEGEWPPVDYPASGRLWPVFASHLRGYGFKLLPLFAYYRDCARNEGGTHPAARWDEDFQQRLDWSRRFLELLQQSQSETVPLGKQVALFAADWLGLIAGLDAGAIQSFARAFLTWLDSEPEFVESLRAGCSSREKQTNLTRLISDALAAWESNRAE